MNITDQIIEHAERVLPFERSQIYSLAKILSGNDRIDFYKKTYSERSKELCEKHQDKLQSFSPGRLTRFDNYSDLVDFFSIYFKPLSTHEEIEFHDIENDTPAIGPNRQPIVKKGYNFARDYESGKSLSDFLKSLMLLNWLKKEIGYDVKQHPVKANIVAFKNESTIFIFYKDYEKGLRLYYDLNGNEEILVVYDEIFFLRKSFSSIFPLIQNLPYYEGDEAQYKFDIEWYKNKKQSPLSYRCFPTIQYMIITPDPNPEQCKHNGEYCIKKEEIDERYSRFLKVYNQLETKEKEELLLNTIDYFERFLKTDCFELTIHKKYFEEILSKLKALNPFESIQKEFAPEWGLLEESKPNTAEKTHFTNAEDFIGFFNGSNYLNNRKIMKESDYLRLVIYTQELINRCRVPDNIIPIPKINLRKQDIVYTFSRIHDHVCPSGKLRKEYFYFLNSIFSQLNQSELNIEESENYLKSNCYKKFRIKPEYYEKIANL